jgi:hypothetical protein
LINILNACPTEIDFDVYQPRNPKTNAYYRCVEDHFEQLETVWFPARRAYSSERKSVISAASAFGGRM